MQSTQDVDPKEPEALLPSIKMLLKKRQERGPVVKGLGPNGGSHCNTLCHTGLITLSVIKSYHLNKKQVVAHCGQFYDADDVLCQVYFAISSP